MTFERNYVYYQVKTFLDLFYSDRSFFVKNELTLQKYLYRYNHK